MLISPIWQMKKFEVDDAEAHVGHAQLSHYTARFREWGNGPPLILVPGLAGGIGLVTPLAKQLSRYFRVIAYELRGENDCFALRRQFAMRDLVDDLAEFLDWQGVERPDLLGVSFGAVVGMELAARHPNRLRSLSVQGLGARFERGLVKSVASLALSGYPLPADNPFVNQFFQLLFGRGPQPKFLIDRVARLCWQTDQSVMTHRLRLVRHMDLTRCVTRVRIPVLAMAAERDVLVSNQSLCDLYNRLEDVKFVRLPAGGHLAFVHDPRRIADEVIAFATNDV
jgi:pimeloyl-ACP methyl ester carboxylesterase